MSRIGKRPIPIPQGVTVTIAEGVATVRGKLGTITAKLPVTELATVAVEDGAIKVARTGDSPSARREQGLVRALLQNHVTGVTEGYKRELDIVGVGYKAEVKSGKDGSELHISVGYAYPKVFKIPPELKVKVEAGNRIFLESIDKWVIGQAAAHIRKIRPPEPYKGKGIRYYDEYIKRKVGKAAVGTTGG